MKTTAFLPAIIAAASLNAQNNTEPVYLDVNAPIEARVEDALSRMTIEEKVGLLHAQSKFSSAGVPRLGIPELWCSDGPHGIRAEVLWSRWSDAGWTNDSCTAFPALTCLASTWNPELAREYGRAIGEEARYRKKQVLLGPGVNIGRTPLNGRTFEYMGEDPLLAATLVVPYIEGVQSNDVAACVKHFALNNNELNRHYSDVHVSDRALREIYLPAFKAAVDGGVWAVMPSYNLYDGRYVCENPRLIKEILKGEWGFDGVTISDWGGVHHGDEVIEGGLDLEMGTHTDGLGKDNNEYANYYMALHYLELLKSGQADTAELNDHARRVLRTIFRTSMSSSHWPGRFTCPEHTDIARRIGAEGIVLLKNEGNLLPIDPARVKRVLVVGENAVKMMTVGGGSSSLKAQHEITPLQGLINNLDSAIHIEWERGYIGVGTTEYNKVKVSDAAMLEESRTPDELKKAAIEQASKADMVIFVGGLNKERHNDAENYDRTSLNLPYGQEELIMELSKACPNLVVVNISGAPVAMPWADNADAIIQCWYLGSEAGNSLADVLTGAVNPSGKLPFSIPYTLEDTPTWGERRYPGIKRDDSPIHDVYYDEDILIGYRWYDTMGKDVQFPFGYGLSYSDFAIKNLNLSTTKLSNPDDSITITADVTNNGLRAGAETVQVYIASPAPEGLIREKQELAGFRKVYLQPGETQVVTIDIPASRLSYYNEKESREEILNGEYTLSIGNSSRSLPLKASFTYTD